MIRIQPPEPYICPQLCHQRASTLSAACCCLSALGDKATRTPKRNPSFKPSRPARPPCSVARGSSCQGSIRGKANVLERDSEIQKYPGGVPFSVDPVASSSSGYQRQQSVLVPPRGRTPLPRPPPRGADHSVSCIKYLGLPISSSCLFLVGGGSVTRIQPQTYLVTASIPPVTCGTAPSLVAEQILDRKVALSNLQISHTTFSSNTWGERTSSRTTSWVNPAARSIVSPAP